MDKNTKNEILKGAIDTFGIDAQIDMAIEEMSELTKALCKYKRSVKKYKCLRTHPLGVFDNVREEIADVEIMLEQMRIVFDALEVPFGAQSFIDRIKESKLTRLAETVTETNKEKILGKEKVVAASPDDAGGSEHRYFVPFWEFAAIKRGERKYIAVKSEDKPEKGETIYIEETNFREDPTGKRVTATVWSVLDGLMLVNEDSVIVEIDII